MSMAEGDIENYLVEGDRELFGRGGQIDFFGRGGQRDFFGHHIRIYYIRVTLRSYNLGTWLLLYQRELLIVFPTKK